ncbi:uncharacterized protein LAESUDRAFT_765315 [Laetiporus sulphureus 93-53]|uniref:Uncharacterized protein n=1 Tax=Laetiporus sulphureus 93-53 TaxID=1314785 RepID=A0A165ATM5_9APHY|nr:uncharacterized protein LAESUDRAFT_765315 [Laetiporus sulphureus 93-53]KZS99642.1 hypothetical protein LAESUDRAFT_765315 [Laetiporus sulphureus 93-53]
MELEAKQSDSQILLSLNALLEESVTARQRDTAILAKLNNQSDELLKRVQETPAQKLKSVYTFDKITPFESGVLTPYINDMHRLQLSIQEAVSIGMLNAIKEELRELDQAFHL